MEALDAIGIALLLLLLYYHLLLCFHCLSVIQLLFLFLFLFIFIFFKFQESEDFIWFWKWSFGLWFCMLIYLFIYLGLYLIGKGGHAWWCMECKVIVIGRWNLWFIFKQLGVNYSQFDRFVGILISFSIKIYLGTNQLSLFTWFEWIKKI